MTSLIRVTDVDTNQIKPFMPTDPFLSHCTCTISLTLWSCANISFQAILDSFTCRHESIWFFPPKLLDVTFKIEQRYGICFLTHPVADLKHLDETSKSATRMFLTSSIWAPTTASKTYSYYDWKIDRWFDRLYRDAWEMHRLRRLSWR